MAAGILVVSVLRLADEGDPAARAIVAHEASEIARTTAAVVRKLGLPAERVPLAMAAPPEAPAPLFDSLLPLAHNA